MDVLKIVTAGSVDDGKSTLIGRLLLDTGSLATDRLESVVQASRRKGLGFTDLSLLTDGLIAEREQGITIDVAHIYFSTLKRKYIIADAPGHIEYTRNMITGASNSEASIILVDARQGLLEQTRRHIFISSLLKMQTIFICINKMDLVAFSKDIYDTIKEEIQGLLQDIQFAGDIYFIPVVAREGDNIVDRSESMSWYTGQTLLELLEAIPVHQKKLSLPARLPVQFVIRPQGDEYHDFRGYAGRMKTGHLRTGGAVTILPSMLSTSIKSIHVADQLVHEAKAGESVVVELENDVDVSRGNMIVPSDEVPESRNSFMATVCWMDNETLVPGRTFILQHDVNLVKAKVTGIESILDISTMDIHESPEQLKLNDIGRIFIKTSKPVFADAYEVNPGNGAFILIDEFSNNTVAVGFVR